MYYLLMLWLHLRPDHISLNRNLDYCVPLWQEEVKHRGITNPFIVFVHGSSEDGVWYSYPDSLPKLPADGVVLFFRLLNMDKQLVFMSCNHAAADLHVPSVYYAKDYVWCEPGDSVRLVDAYWRFADDGLFYVPARYEVGVGRIGLFRFSQNP
jgi:hypothetical protein